MEYKKVYIVGDLVIDMEEEDFYDTFTTEQVEALERGEKIDWIDENGEDHIVRMVTKVKGE